jgi:CheY-like chemotaxis protein
MTYVFPEGQPYAAGCVYPVPACIYDVRNITMSTTDATSAPLSDLTSCFADPLMEPSTSASFDPAKAAEALRKTAKVMIVDDEPVNVKVVQKYLSLAGYEQFVTSTDPRPALDMISREMPDVILLDVMMPGISGLEILRKVREDPRLAHIPALILTAADNEQTRIEALELGATDFLGKPVNSVELAVRVRNALIVKAS